jgi:hypothetical protein
VFCDTLLTIISIPSTKSCQPMLRAVLRVMVNIAVNLETYSSIGIPSTIRKVKTCVLSIKLMKKFSTL